MANGMGVICLTAGMLTTCVLHSDSRVGAFCPADCLPERTARMTEHPDSTVPLAGSTPVALGMLADAEQTRIGDQVSAASHAADGRDAVPDTPPRAASDALERLTRLIAALDRAAAGVQEAQRADTIPALVGDALRAIGIESQVALLDTPVEAPASAAEISGESGPLRIAYLSIAPKTRRIAERLIGRSVVDMTIPIERVGIFAQIVRTHQPCYLAGPLPAMREVLPWVPEAALRQLARIVHAGGGIAAPLLSRGRVLGVMSVWADDLRLEDTAVLGSFARQVGVALDNARLNAAAERQAHRLARLNAIGRDLALTLEIEEVLARATAHAADALDTAHAALWLIESGAPGPEASTAQVVLRLAASHGLTPRHAELAARLSAANALADTPALRVATTRSVEYCGDLQAAPLWMSPSVRQLLVEEGYRAFVAAPVVTPSDEAIGALLVYTRSPGRLSPEDGPYLETIGRYAAVAIEQARLFREVKSSRELLAAIFETNPGAIAVLDGPNAVVRVANPRLRAVSAQPDADPVGHSIHELFPSGYTSLVNGLRAAVDAVRDAGHAVTFRSVALHASNGIPERTMTLHLAPIQIESVNEDALLATSMALHPVRSEPSDKRVLMIMWDTTAHVQAETRLAAQVRRAEILATVALSLEKERDLSALLSRVARAARDLTDATAAGFLLRAGPQAPFEVAAIVGVAPPAVAALRRPFVPELMVLGPLLKQRRALLLADASAAAMGAEARLLARAHVHALAGTPLTASAGWTLGALVVGHHASGAFTTEHIALLEALAAQATAAIERTRAFEEAQRQADELEATFASMADGVAIIDPQGVFLRMNDAGQRITRRAVIDGESPTALRARFALRRTDGAALSEDLMPSIRAIRGETFHSAEYLVDGQDGPDTVISVSGAPLRGMDGAARGGVIIFRNVTQVRRLERRTQEALQSLLGIAATLAAPSQGPTEDRPPISPQVAPTEPADSDGESGTPRASEDLPRMLRHLCQLAIGVLGCDRVAIHLVDPETRMVTPGAAAGLTPEEESEWLAEQRSQRGYGEPRQFGTVNPEAVARLMEGEPALIDMTQPPYSDQPNPYAARLALVVPMMVDRRIVGMLAVDHRTRSQDAPPHIYVREEIALAEGVARLAGLAVERRRLEHVASEVEALRAANALKEEFLSIASHELRTPLTVLQARTQSTGRRLKRLGHPEAAAQFAPVQASLDRMLKLVQELLDASRIQTGHLELQLEPCDLGALVTTAVAEAREAQEYARPITLEGADTPGLWTRGDRERLSQVVTNLLDNAHKYSPHGLPIVVRVWREPASRTAGPASNVPAPDAPADRNEIVITVADQGIGVPPDEVAHVFERFYRARTSSARQYGGLGLGLHIAATIVERHGGRIWAKSPGPDMGSTFGVALPVFDPPADVLRPAT
jgi:signal transduction histidine kinase/PAS domain-containing protein